MARTLFGQVHVCVVERNAEQVLYVARRGRESKLARSDRRLLVMIHSLLQERADLGLSAHASLFAAAIWRMHRPSPSA